MRKIIYTRPDGGLSVVHPVINTHPEPEDITEAEAEDRAWEKLPKYAIDPQFVDESAIPADRTFRDAWKAGAGKVEHDMGKAREIHKDRLRALRAPLFATLDGQRAAAVRKGDAARISQIDATAQALADVTDHPAIATAKTPAALKAAVPDVLAKG